MGEGWGWAEGGTSGGYATVRHRSSPCTPASSERFKSVHTFTQRTDEHSDVGEGVNEEMKSRGL